MDGRKPRKQIALLYPVAVPWIGRLFQSVAKYAEEHGGWRFLTSPPTLSGSEEFALTLRNMRGWPGQGIIASITNPEDAEAARQLRIPVVNISGAMANSELPCAIIDNVAIGRTAADHLLACGFRRLAFYGISGLWYSEKRRDGFIERAREVGVDVEVFETPRPYPSDESWQRRMSPLQEWLKKLKPPLGLMALHDYRARVVVDECLRLGLNVPHDIAVVGVDNDPITCEYGQISLSSVSRNPERQGYEVAALLDCLMNGQEPPSRTVIIPPDGVIVRRSTNTIAVDDPNVTMVIRYMRDNLGKRFSVEQALAVAPVSIRRLQKQFHRYLHCTPLEYLSRLRVEKAKQLLTDGRRLKIRNIAVLCGFSDLQHMRSVFRRITGVTAKEFREVHSGNADLPPTPEPRKPARKSIGPA